MLAGDRRAPRDGVGSTGRGDASTAFVRRRTKRCYRCGQPGHIRRDCVRGHRRDGETTDQVIGSHGNRGRKGHIRIGCPGVSSWSVGAAGARRVRCYSCGELGHIRRECSWVHDRGAEVSTIRRIRCYNCGESGHKNSECPRKRNESVDVTSAGHGLRQRWTEREQGKDHSKIVETPPVHHWGPRCYRCGERGHYQASCTNDCGGRRGAGYTRTYFGPRCFKCGRRGHLQMDCSMGRRVEEWSEERQRLPLGATERDKDFVGGSTRAGSEMLGTSMSKEGAVLSAQTNSNIGGK